MANSSPYPIVLTVTDREELERILARATSEYRAWQRALIVLSAADGLSCPQIAAKARCSEPTVRKWRRRFFHERLAGLADRPRSGRPVLFTPLQHAEVKAIGCTLPANKDVPLARWSISEIVRQAMDEGIVVSISPTTVRRFLHEAAIKPWQTRSWITPRAPDFATKGGIVLDLYQRISDGQLLGENDYVISADEKTQLQALHRRTPTRPAGPFQPRRVESDYVRGGTLAYFAALDVHSGKVMGHIAQKTGIAPFAHLVEHVMTTEPYASASNVYWIVDNGSSHAKQASIDRMHAAYPTAHLIHLPVHASWLNQIEIYFSILTHKALTGESFDDLDQLTDRIWQFQERHNALAQPFAWNYTRTQLNDYLQRIDHAAYPETN